MFGAYQPHYFYHPDNKEGVEKRTLVGQLNKYLNIIHYVYRKCAMKALGDLINYLNEEDGQVAVSMYV